MIKNKKIIFIIWGLFISVSVIGLLIILLLALQPEQASKSTPKQIQTPQQPNSQQEDKTYNTILKKIEAEVDKLTKNLIENHYQSDGKTLDYIIYNNKEGQKVQEIHYKSDGKTIDYITDYDTKTGNELLKTYYNPDGTVKQAKKCNTKNEEIEKQELEKLEKKEQQLSKELSQEEIDKLSQEEIDKLEQEEINY
uniref:DUF2963 domain-containing protein n=1 Tax=Paulownia witches'-broom phytoplasma TaxID=39647 RepID=B1N8X2_9MOLU|nr:DUF2963 domain-containing protein [Paulownia witches'-broom phytoplasma]ABR08384.1 hypothetical protein [Paulownia witches'-broom phytoplasma]